MSEVAALHRPVAERSEFAFSPSGMLSLAAVIAVLIVVSVPSLRGFARHENEADARRTVRVLAAALADMHATAGDLPTFRELMRRPEVARLSDSELLAQGSLLRRHGYLFEITLVPPSLSVPCTSSGLIFDGGKALGAVPVVRAWPWAAGTTGRACFLATSKGGVLVHPGRGLPGWDGPGAARTELRTLEGWRPTRAD